MVKIWTGRSWVLPKHLLKMRRSNYPDNCLIIDINSMDSMKKMLREGTLQIFFRFHRIAGFNVELKLEDRERVVERADKSGRLAYSGPLMRWETKITITLLKSITNRYLFRMDGLVESRRKEYMVEVHKSEHVEGDPAQGCKRYPNPQFQTFNDCDMAFMRRGIAASYFAYPSFNPLMVAENESDATSWIEVGSEFYDPKQFNFRDMSDGTTPSDCPPPCTLHHISASFLAETARNKNYSEIVLTMSNTVTATATTFPRFKLDLALAELGGSMGLWLGLGILQIIEIVTKGISARFH